MRIMHTYWKLNFNLENQNQNLLLLYDCNSYEKTFFFYAKRHLVDTDLWLRAKNSVLIPRYVEIAIFAI